MASNNREERLQMRQRGAGSRSIKQVDFGFSFGLAPPPAEASPSSQSASQPAEDTGPAIGPSQPPQPPSATENIPPTQAVSSQNATTSKIPVPVQRTPGSARNALPERPSTFDIPPDEPPDIGRSSKRRRIASPKLGLRPSSSRDSSQPETQTSQTIQNGIKPVASSEIPKGLSTTPAETSTGQTEAQAPQETPAATVPPMPDATPAQPAEEPPAETTNATRRSPRRQEEASKPNGTESHKEDDNRERGPSVDKRGAKSKSPSVEVQKSPPQEKQLEEPPKEATEVDQPRGTRQRSQPSASASVSPAEKGSPQNRAGSPKGKATERTSPKQQESKKLGARNEKKPSPEAPPSQPAQTTDAPQENGEEQPLPQHKEANKPGKRAGRPPKKASQATEPAEDAPRPAGRENRKRKGPEQAQTLEQADGQEQVKEPEAQPAGRSKRKRQEAEPAQTQTPEPEPEAEPVGRGTKRREAKESPTQEPEPEPVPQPRAAGKGKGKQRETEREQQAKSEPEPEPQLRTAGKRKGKQREVEPAQSREEEPEPQPQPRTAAKGKRKQREMEREQQAEPEPEPEPKLTARSRKKRKEAEHEQAHEPEVDTEAHAEREPEAESSSALKRSRGKPSSAKERQPPQTDESTEPQANAEERPSRPTRKPRQPRGETVPVTVHRLANVASLAGVLPSADSSDEEEGSADELEARQKTKLPGRGGVNAADVLGQICRETLEKTLKTLQNGIENETNNARRAEWTRKKKAVEAFGSELEGRLFELSEMLDSNFVLGIKLRKAKREMMDMRSRLYKIRQERERVALQMDAVRRKHSEEESARMSRTTINNSLHSLDLALERSRKQQPPDDSNPADASPTAGLEFLLRSVAENVSSRAGGAHGGLLNQIKSFNAQLEAAAHQLES